MVHATRRKDQLKHTRFDAAMGESISVEADAVSTRGNYEK
jgi:hypothetical protein